MTPTSKVCVVLPAYNVAATIGPLIQQIKALRLDPIVVNDGSTDRTVRTATDAGAFVMSHLANRGKGLALRTGFEFAMQNGYERIVTMDSDGQHDPAEIPRLLDAARDPQIAIVVGHRLIDASRMPWVRRATNRVMSEIVSRTSVAPRVTRPEIGAMMVYVEARRWSAAIPSSSAATLL